MAIEYYNIEMASQKYVNFFKYMVVKIKNSE